jgi:hypothetical protein
MLSKQKRFLLFAIAAGIAGIIIGGIIIAMTVTDFLNL